MSTPSERSPLLERLYRISLEESGRWFMFLGFSRETWESARGVHIDRLQSYIFGYQESQDDLGVKDPEAGLFWKRLLDHRHDPEEGWPQRCLDRAEGNHLRAVGNFFTLLHEYLLLARPPWFDAFNSSPQRSLMSNGAGEPLQVDVRRPDHIAASRTPRPPPGPTPFGMLTQVRLKEAVPDQRGTVIPAGSIARIFDVFGEFEGSVLSYEIEVEGSAYGSERRAKVTHAQLEAARPL